MLLYVSIYNREVVFYNFLKWGWWSWKSIGARGNKIFGKHLVEALLQEGHDVTIATRGITEDSFGSAVKRLIVDREDENN